MKVEQAGTGRGIGFGGMLAILFIALKLTKVVAWSWVWVLSPLWIPLALIVAILLIALCFGIVSEMLK